MIKIFQMTMSCAAVILLAALVMSAQMTRRDSGIGVKPEASATPVPAKTPGKKNERPSSTPADDKDPVTDSKNGHTYRYEFSQPAFIVSHVVIEHDASGKGKITFERSDADGTITDPLKLSQVTLDKVNNLLKTLNFLDSTEDYQSPIRDYGHLGNYTITVSQDGKTRTAKYNWSENLDARALSGEYRKITEQNVWIFDIGVSVENQPLESPGLMDRLDSLLQRSEISDPSQMLPKLKELSNDERIPLIARNHAARMAKSIESKATEKTENK